MEPRTLTLLLALALHGAAAFFAIRAFVRRAEGGERLLGLATVGALAAHAAFVVVSWRNHGVPPITALPATALVFSWLLAAGGLALRRMLGIAALPAFTSPLVLALFVAGAFTGGWPGGPGERLVGVALALHVATAVAAYVAFAIGFAAALMFLWQERALRSRRLGGSASRLPSLETLDRALHGTLLSGLPLLTTSLVLGAGWQRSAGTLGQEWLLDPKVIFGLITWAVYASILLARQALFLHGRRVAVISIAAFGVVLFTLLGTRHLL
ncbi:MAG: cytochrome c biogenesis protein CcsA [Planctomycetes bacterium]|nr:cytochrome c biogenesis protein CcsA [Planctomycetota bacterium]